MSYPSVAQPCLAALEESSFWFRHRNRVIRTFIQRYLPCGPIIDVGGGNGAVSLELWRSGISSIVLEPGEDAASTAHARGLTVIRGAFDPRIFVEGSVRAIGLFDVIEHTADDVQFLADTNLVMANGGFIYVTVPALRSLWSSDDEFAGHYRRYNRHSLQQALTSAGFEVLAISSFFSLLVPLLFLFRTLPSACGLRKVDRVDKALDHHRSGTSTGALMERLLRVELSVLARGHSLPIGTSLIAVARKPAS